MNRIDGNSRFINQANWAGYPRPNQGIFLFKPHHYLYNYYKGDQPKLAAILNAEEETIIIYN
jgi:hypothetical protein